MRNTLIGSGILAVLVASVLLVHTGASAQAPSLEARVTGLERTVAELREHVDRLESRTYGMTVDTDIDRLRFLVGLLTSGKRIPMRDGSLDPYAVADDMRGLDVPRVRAFRSARTGRGPSGKEIDSHDYTNLPWERYHGPEPVLYDFERPVPLLWDKEPDSEGGYLVGLSNGSVRYWDGERLAAALREVEANR